MQAAASGLSAPAWALKVGFTTTRSTYSFLGFGPRTLPRPRPTLQLPRDPSLCRAPGTPGPGDPRSRNTRGFWAPGFGPVCRRHVRPHCRPELPATSPRLQPSCAVTCKEATSFHTGNRSHRRSSAWCFGFRRQHVFGGAGRGAPPPGRSHTVWTTPPPPLPRVEVTRHRQLSVHLNFIHTERCHLCPHVGGSACGRDAGEVQDPPQGATGLAKAGLLFLINKNNSKNIYIYINGRN